MEELNLWLIATLSSVVLGVVKWGIPLVKDKVPNLVWPIALVILGKGGTAVCESLGAACAGSPAGWGPVEATALATALIAIVQRELISGLRNGIPTFDRLIQSAVSKLTSNKGGTVNSILIAAVLAASLLVPVTVSAQEAAAPPDSGKAWAYGTGEIPFRPLLGMTFSSGLKDSAGNFTMNLPLKGLVVTHRSKRVVELGMLSGGVTGAAGNDAAPSSGSASLVIAGGGCLFEWSCFSAGYVFDQQAENNVVVLANIEPVKTAENIIATFVKWNDLIVRRAAPTPGGVYLASFRGMNALSP